MNGMWLACLVGIGGAAGTLLRYGVGRLLLAKNKPGYYGTLSVNLAGSLAMGLLIGLRLEQENAAAYALAGIGFLGGLTTYSTLNVQKATLSGSGSRRTLTLYLGATYIGGLGATALGFALGTYLHT
jgi:CrcB protein